MAFDYPLRVYGMIVSPVAVDDWQPYVTTTRAIGVTADMDAVATAAHELTQFSPFDSTRAIFDFEIASQHQDAMFAAIAGLFGVSPDEVMTPLAMQNALIAQMPLLAVQGLAAGMLTQEQANTLAGMTAVVIGYGERLSAISEAVLYLSENPLSVQE